MLQSNLKEKKFFAFYNNENLEINLSLKKDFLLISTEMKSNILPIKFFNEFSLSKLKSNKIFDNLDSIEDIFNFLIMMINNNENLNNKILIQKNKNENSNENKENSNENKENNNNNNIILSIPTNIKKFNQITFELKKINTSINTEINYLFNLIKKLQKEKDEFQAEIEKNYIKKSDLPKIIENYINIHINKQIFPESKIILPEENKLICNWISNKNIQAKFLYRASIDGDSSKDFHNKCDNKGATICFFKLNNGCRIGGFSSVSWSMNGGCKKDANAFIFSLDNKEKYCLRNKNENAVFHCKNGPVFWNGVSECGDIVVKQDCLVRDFGIQLFDKTYETSVKKLCGIESEGFKLMKLEDYEVFQIIF